MKSTVVINITFAIVLIGGAFALWESSKLPTASTADAYAMRRDRCPYYPSPALCGMTSDRVAG